MVFRAFLVPLVFWGSLYSFEVTLDIGHTPGKGGATSAACVKEYEYNKALGKYLIDSRLSHSNVHFQMLHQHEITFQERYASSIGKDLFFSIHHDSVQPQYIQKSETGCPTTEHASGYSLFVSRKNGHFKQSLVYAKRFGEALLRQGLSPSLHHAEKIPGENRELIDPKLGIYLFDDLKVLKNAQSPAVLFEAGVIVNPKDEARVQTEEFKKKIVDALEAISKL